MGVWNATTAPANGDHEIYIELWDQFANKVPEPGTWIFKTKLSPELEKAARALVAAYKRGRRTVTREPVRLHRP